MWVCGVRWVASEGSLVLLVVVGLRSDGRSDWLGGRSVRRIVVGRLVLAFTGACLSAEVGCTGVRWLFAPGVSG